MVTSRTCPEGSSPFKGTSFFKGLKLRTAPPNVLVHIFLMNLSHVLSSTLLDEHVFVIQSGKLQHRSQS